MSHWEAFGGRKQLGFNATLRKEDVEKTEQVEHLAAVREIISLCERMLREMGTEVEGIAYS